MSLPQLNGEAASRDWVESFGGYNHNLKIADGEFWDMKNLNSDNYPVMSPRDRKHAVWGNVTADLAWNQILRNGVVEDVVVYGGSYYALVRTGDDVPEGYQNKLIIMTGIWLKVPITQLWAFVPAKWVVGDAASDKKHYIVTADAFMYIFPEGYYINFINPQDEATPDKGSLGNWFASGSKTVTVTLSDENGTAIAENPSPTEPTSPADGTLWLDSSGDNLILKRYSAALTLWAPVQTYLRIECDDIIDGFSVGEALKMSVESSVQTVIAEDYPEIIKLQAAASTLKDYVLIKGTMKSAKTESGALKVKMARDIPAMDYVVACGNRLWGCKYGTNTNTTTEMFGNETFVNEIYASALGNPKVWRKYGSISTDSYAVSLGGTDAFTGAAVYDNCPMFFRRNSYTKIFGTHPANYQVITQECNGAYYHKTICNVDNVMFYVGIDGVYAYSGSMPVKISDQFGNETYEGIAAFPHNHKYYVCLKSDKCRLFAYDTQKAMWHIEDDAVITCGSESAYWDDTQKELMEFCVREYGYMENKFEWYGESGNIGLYTPDNKYLQKITMRMSLDVGARVAISIMYDSSGKWERMFTATGTNLTSFNVPIRPRKCDHFRIRIDGTGEAKIYSLSKTIMQGSDVYR